MSIGDKITFLRKESNMTQEQLADLLSVSRQSVSRWESNIAFPETDKLIQLCNIFKCSSDYLLKDEITDKNANSIGVSMSTLISHYVSLATIGVCVFSALASVGALLVQYKHNNNSSLMD